MLKNLNNQKFLQKDKLMVKKESNHGKIVQIVIDFSSKI